jgi:hypothetical protein
MSNEVLKSGDTQPIPMATERAAPQTFGTPSLVRLERSVQALWLTMVLVGLLALASLAVNAVLVVRLLAIRNQLSEALTSASRSLDNLAGQSIAFDFPISQTISLETDVPLKQDISFPFKGNFPVNTTVSVPLNLGPLLGTQVVNVPINTAVPVDMNVPIHIDQTFHIKTQVPVRMNVPIRLSPNDPPLRDWLTLARAWLQGLRRSL